MRIRRAIIRMVALLATLSGAIPATAQIDPVEIVDHVDLLLRGDSSRGVASMEVVTENWDRTMSMEAWSLGADHFLVRLISPAKEAGIATLKAGNNIWNYLPRIDRTIKIPMAMMGGSWMGSHFTNDDLVKQSRLSADYDIRLSFDGPDLDGVVGLGFHPSAEARRRGRMGAYRVSSAAAGPHAASCVVP